MLKKKLSILLIFFLIITLTGCTKIMRDENNKLVRYEKTGQNLTSNILCKPTNKDVINLYKKNKISIDKLPKCSDFTITTGGYEGLWTTFFVKPLAYLIIKIGGLIKNYGLAVIISSLLIRAAVMPITKKSAVQSESMKKAQPELQKIESKYKNKTDQESMMKKSQETLMIYKKYDINPIFGCLFAIIQLPLFFAFLEAINRVPAIFENNFLGLHLGTTPNVGLLQHGNILYGIVMIAIVLTTYYSFKLSATSVSKEQEQQMKFMSIFMLVFISFASLSLPTAVALYWISSSLFTILQNFMVKKGDKKI
jgi:YidC/Oxa1 family membrane protein insertase